MEPLNRKLDQEITRALSDACPDKGPASIFIVAADDLLRATMLATLQNRDHRCACAARLDQARATLARDRFDLVLVNTRLPDWDGLELAPLIQKTSPTTKIIAISEQDSIKTAVQAMRCGVSDLVIAPIDLDEFAARIDAALLKARAEQQRDQRLIRLQKICGELNVARNEISGQVDALCDDLMRAYQEMAAQMDDAVMASEFRTLLKQELDAEDLLRTMLEYLLTKTGPTNAAVFLPDHPGEAANFSLGAYVNYECQRETVSTLLDHLCGAICPQMANEKQIISFTDAREFSEWIGGDASILADCQVIAFSCLHKGDCLAVIVLFRNNENPFNEELAATLDTLRGIFAEQLSNVIRVHHRAGRWPKEAKDGDLDFNDDMGFGYGGGIAA